MALTKTQRQKAARLWGEGVRMREIVDAMGITFHELKYDVEAHRAMYPRRHAMGAGND